jgi:hypothetical protein
MPMFTFTAAVLTGATYLPLSTWQFRQPARKAILEVFVNATAVGCVQNLTTGSESIVQAENPVSAGGTAGVLPARLNTEPAVDMVDPGDELVLTVRNTSGGTITVNGVAVLTYKD